MTDETCGLMFFVTGVLGLLIATLYQVPIWFIFGAYILWKRMITAGGDRDDKKG